MPSSMQEFPAPKKKKRPEIPRGNCGAAVAQRMLKKKTPSPGEESEREREAFCWGTELHTENCGVASFQEKKELYHKQMMEEKVIVHVIGKAPEPWQDFNQKKDNGREKKVSIFQGPSVRSSNWISLSLRRAIGIGREKNEDGRKEGVLEERFVQWEAQSIAEQGNCWGGKAAYPETDLSCERGL